MADRERRIQEIAYLLWEGEGRPDGQADRFWHMAEAAYEAEIEVTGGEGGGHLSAEAAATLADVAEAEAGPGPVPAFEAEGPGASAPKKRAAKPKVAAPDEGKAEPKAKAVEAEPVKPAAAKPKAKKFR